MPRTDRICRPYPLRLIPLRLLLGCLLLRLYSALAPDAFTTLDHWVSSRSMSAAYSAGVDGSGSAPSMARRGRTAGLGSTGFGAGVSFLMTGGGVAGGAARA